MEHISCRGDIGYHKKSYSSTNPWTWRRRSHRLGAWTQIFISLLFSTSLRSGSPFQKQLGALEECC